MPRRSVHAQTSQFVQADPAVAEAAGEVDETEDTNEGGVLTNAYVILGLMLFFVFCVMYFVYILSDLRLAGFRPDEGSFYAILFVLGLMYLVYMVYSYK